MTFRFLLGTRFLVFLLPSLIFTSALDSPPTTSLLPYIPQPVTSKCPVFQSLNNTNHVTGISYLRGVLTARTSRNVGRTSNISTVVQYIVTTTDNEVITIWDSSFPFQFVTNNHLTPFLGYTVQIQGKILGCGVIFNGTSALMATFMPTHFVPVSKKPARTLALVYLYFKDSANFHTAPTYSIIETTNKTFSDVEGSVNIAGAYHRYSNDQVTFSGKVNSSSTADTYGWYEITADTCLEQDWSTAAAIAAQVHADDYDHIMFVRYDYPALCVNVSFHPGIADYYSYWTMVDFSWIFGNTPMHELGHNIGYGHSGNYYSCLSNSTQDCTYADITDAMGYSYSTNNGYVVYEKLYFSHWRRWIMGWAHPNSIQFITTSGQFTLVNANDTSSSSSSLMSLMIPISQLTDNYVTEAYDTHSYPYLHVEYLNLRGSPYLIVRLVAVNSLVDMKELQFLGPGSKFTSQSGYIQVTFTQLNADGTAEVDVKLNYKGQSGSPFIPITFVDGNNNSVPVDHFSGFSIIKLTNLTMPSYLNWSAPVLYSDDLSPMVGALGDFWNAMNRIHAQPIYVDASFPNGYLLWGFNQTCLFTVDSQGYFNATVPHASANSGCTMTGSTKNGFIVSLFNYKP